MDEQVVNLLRQLADCLEHAYPEENPLGEIMGLGKRAVAKLVRALGHEEQKIRQMAVFALGYLHSPDSPSSHLAPAIPRLKRMARSEPDSFTRLYAAEVLWMIRRCRTAVRAFVRGLEDKQVRVRRLAATMLGEVRARTTIGPLIEALGDCDLLVRRHAAQSLAAFGPAARRALRRLEKLLDEDEWTRVIGGEAMLRINPSYTECLSPVLTQALRSHSPRIRHYATQVLENLPAAGRLAVPHLIEALKDPDSFVRMGAFWALEELGAMGAPAVPALITVLQDWGEHGNGTMIQAMAAMALGEIGPEARDALSTLLGCLQRRRCDSPRHFHLEVAQAIWRIEREPRYLLSLGIEALADAGWWLRRESAKMLGELGPAGAAAIPHLVQALKDEHRLVRRQAQRSLERIAAHNRLS